MYSDDLYQMDGNSHFELLTVMIFTQCNRCWEDCCVESVEELVEATVWACSVVL